MSVAGRVVRYKMLVEFYGPAFKGWYTARFLRLRACSVDSLSLRLCRDVVCAQGTSTVACRTDCVWCVGASFDTHRHRSSDCKSLCSVVCRGAVFPRHFASGAFSVVSTANVYICILFVRARLITCIYSRVVLLVVVGLMRECTRSQCAHTLTLR